MTSEGKMGRLLVNGQEMDPTGYHDEDLSSLMGAVLGCELRLSEDECIKIIGESFREKLVEGARSNKLVSRKNLARFQSKIFSVPLKDGILYYNFKNLSAKSLRSSNVAEHNRFQCYYAAICWASTPKGRIYYSRLASSGTMIFFYSHFFDRLSQRSYDSELTRSQAIFTFLRRIGEDSGNVLLTNNFQLEFYLPEGLAIGYGARCGTSDDGTLSIDHLGAEHLHGSKGRIDEHLNIILLTTYVSDDMLRADQRGRRERARKEGRFWRLDHKLVVV
jgi:hypothetical protein